MPATEAWPPDGGSLTLDHSDERLKAITSFLLLHNPAPDQPLVVPEATMAQSGDTLRGLLTAWGSQQAELEFRWFPETEMVRRISLSKPIEIFEGIRLPFLQITDFRQHCAAEVMAERGHGTARHTGWMSGSLKIREQLVVFELRGYGVPAFDLYIDFQAPANAGGRPLGLRDLAGLLGLTDDPHADLQWLPNELQSEDLISLTELIARLEPSDPKKLTDVSVSLKILSGRTWPMIPGVLWLEVGKLTATLEVEHPLESDYRFPRLTVRGAVVLDGVAADGDDVQIGLKVRWPDLAVEGELQQKGMEIREEPEGIMLAKLLEHLRIPSGGLPRGEKPLTITNLGFLAELDMEEEQFSFHAAVENSWELAGTTLSIERLAFFMSYREGESPTLKPGFSGVIQIGGVDVALSAEREADGWRFSGGSGPGQAINVGDWVKSLAAQFGEVTVPSPVAGADLEKVAVTFNTATKDFHFSIEAKLPLPDSAVMLDLMLTLDLIHHGDSFEKKFAGEIQLVGRKFDLNFSKADATSGTSGSTMVAAYQDADGDTVTLKELLSAVGADLSQVPDLSITLHSAFFAMEKPEGSDTHWNVFGINIDGGLNLSNLPLIGKVLPAHETLSLEFQALYSSQEIGKGDVEKLVNPVNTLLPEGATPLPTVGEGDAPAIKEGISLATSLHLGEEVLHLALPVDIDKKNGIKANKISPSAAKPAPAIIRPDAASGSIALPDDGLKWFPIGKRFGPAHFQRIGAGLQDGGVTFELDASLNVGGLSLSLDGLGVSSPLDKFEPTFRLRGIGIDYAGGPVEVGGSFLRMGDMDFAGTALIKTEALTLSAIGAYSAIGDDTSLFVYAVLDYPLGGPSFCFVTGMAAGFGYNRSLLMPSIDEMASFPLVAEATAGAGLPDDVMAELGKLERYLPPDLGQYFLAVGVKFTSFNLIDSFALLGASFGKRFEIDVIGLSTMVAPTPIPGAAPVEPLAKVSIALMARFIPDEGLLAVDARITPDSFVFSKDCHLSGGFSFYSWFSGDQSGDFILTLGGYHPKFVPPAHYPSVPRLAFNWQVSPELVVKGDAYYALTSHALMAGGHLEASYHSGKLRAHFNVGADFLIAWQPYHYDAEAYLNVGGSYDTLLGTISVDVGAHLHLWGPEFAGTAEVDLYVATIPVTFGDQTPKEKAFISWHQFKKSFLPNEDAVVSVALESGLVESGDPENYDLGIINPKELRITTNSLIPLKISPTNVVKGADHELAGAIGVAPVGVAECASTHTVSISRGDSQDVTSEFRFEPVWKKVPAALWGPPSDEKPQLNPDETFVSGVTGVRISPRKPPTAHASKPVEPNSLVWNDSESLVLPAERLSHIRNDQSAAPGTSNRKTIEETIMAPEVVAARNEYLAALKLDQVNVRVGGLSGMMFSAEPHLGFVSEPIT